MKLKTYLLLLGICSIFLLPAYAQPSTKKTKFKIIGYYPIQSAVSADPTSVPFSKLTHINLWFLNPDSLGTFTKDLSTLAPFIKAAHANNVKVLFSIGGGSKQAQYHRLLQADNRLCWLQI